MTPAQECIILEDRISREKKRINGLLNKVTAVDQEFTEVDINELNNLKQSVVACQRELDRVRERQPTELAATPRPPVVLPTASQPAPEPDSPKVHRQSRSRPRSQKRGPRSV